MRNYKRNYVSSSFGNDGIRSGQQWAHRARFKFTARLRLAAVFRFGLLCSLDFVFIARSTSFSCTNFIFIATSDCVVAMHAIGCASRAATAVASALSTINRLCFQWMSWPRQTRQRAHSHLMESKIVNAAPFGVGHWAKWIYRWKFCNSHNWIYLLCHSDDVHTFMFGYFKSKFETENVLQSPARWHTHTGHSTGECKTVDGKLDEVEERRRRGENVPNLSAQRANEDSGHKHTLFVWTVHWMRLWINDAVCSQTDLCVEPA